MQRSFLASLFVSVLAAVVLFTGGGCGGGGGSSSSGGTTSSPPSGTVYSQQLVGTNPTTSVVRGLGDLGVGETVNIRSLDLYNPVQTAYGNVTNIVLTASPSVATLSGATLHAVGVGTATITATNADGTPLHDLSGSPIGPVTIVVSAVGAKVTGRTRGTITSTEAAAGVGSVLVRFFDSSGSIVAETPTGPDGLYQANVPTTAVSFVIDFSNLPNTYYNQFTYNNLDYAATVSGCGAPISSLSTGGSSSLTDAIAYKKGGSNPPPPPPSGCGG